MRRIPFETIAFISLLSTALSRRLLADVLLVLALCAGKDYLLANVGVFWVLVRVLACGGLVSMVWLATSGQLQAKRVTEVRASLKLLALCVFTVRIVVCSRHVFSTALPALCRSLYFAVPLAFDSVSLVIIPSVYVIEGSTVLYCSLISLPYGSRP